MALSSPGRELVSSTNSTNITAGNFDYMVHGMGQCHHRRARFPTITRAAFSEFNLNAMAAGVAGRLQRLNVGPTSSQPGGIYNLVHVIALNARFVWTPLPVVPTTQRLSRRAILGTSCNMPAMSAWMSITVGSNSAGSGRVL